MEHLALWIYLFGIVDNISQLISGVGTLLWIALGFCSLAFVIATVITPCKTWSWDTTESVENKKATKARVLSLSKRLLKIFLPAAILVSLASSLIPSKETIAAMIIIPKIAANKDVQALPANVAKTLNDAVVAWGKDLAPKKDGSND